MNTDDKRLLIAFLISMLILALFSSGCTKLQYVPVESVRTEIKQQLKRDSIYVRDSIFIRERNDTVFEYRYQKIYIDHFNRDTILITDSIQVPYPVDKIIYKKNNTYRNLFFGMCFITSLFIWLKFRK